MISNQFDVRTGLFGLLLSTPQTVMEEADDARREPGEAVVDAGDGYLNVIQVTVFIWSREVVGAEGAEQQGEEEIQYLSAHKY